MDFTDGEPMHNPQGYTSQERCIRLFVPVILG